MNIKNNLFKFFKGFGYALKGIFSCIKTERNMRFHIGAAFYVLFFMRFFSLTRGERVSVYITIALVIALEAINTAVENTVNLACKGERNPLAKKAKDAAAAGVLITALGAAAAGCELFWDYSGFAAIYKYFSHNVFIAVLLAVSMILWILWVLTADNRKDKDK